MSQGGRLKNPILDEDLSYIHSHFSEKTKLSGATILITGCAGFLGFMFMHYLARYAKELHIKQIIGLDTFQFGKPAWLNVLQNAELIKLKHFNVATDNISDISEAFHANYIMHLASIASPVFYRQFPLETINANIRGLWHLLDFYLDKSVRGFLFFSTSEIYGSPTPDNIPTPESYRGNVASIGPRACYDESKRFGETLCYVYAEKHKFPITIVRPFNNYGPGMKLNDGRVPADFAQAVLNGHDICIHSDGSPTRTFCYIADAIVGYLKALVYGKFDYFNIGIEYPEISVLKLAELFQQHAKDILGQHIQVNYQPSLDKEYLTHNPERRCPIITKAKELLNYRPTIRVEDGVNKFLQFFTYENSFYQSPRFSAKVKECY